MHQRPQKKNLLKIRKLNNLVIILALTLFITCQQKDKSKALSITPNVSEKEITKLKQKILTEGDIDSYHSLEEIYDDTTKGNLLSEALIMANKFNYPKAHFDVFGLLIGLEGCSIDYNLECIDSRTKQLSLTYLRLAIEKGDETASSILIDYYDKGKHYPIPELYSDKKLIEEAKLNLQKE